MMNNTLAISEFYNKYKKGELSKGEYYKILVILMRELNNNDDR